MPTPEMLMDKGRKLITLKAHDYTKDPENNRYENFERSASIAEWFDDPVDKSFATLIGTKLARLATLLNGKSPKNESIEDSFIDLINYGALWGGKVTEYIENRASVMGKDKPFLDYPEDAKEGYPTADESLVTQIKLSLSSRYLSREEAEYLHKAVESRVR